MRQFTEEERSPRDYGYDRDKRQTSLCQISRNCPTFGREPSQQFREWYLLDLKPPAPT
jgi:hypothetical protein